MAEARSSIWRRITVAAFVIALAMRVLVPSGWMAVAADGSFRIAVCSESEAGASSAAQTLFEKALPKHTPSKSDGNDGHCPFANAGAALAAHISPAPPLPTIIADAVIAARPTLAPGRGLAAPPPPKTGPPLLG